MFPPFLIYLVIVLIIIGLALWLIEKIPMNAEIKEIIRVVIIIGVVVWLLYILVGFLPSVPYPRR